MDLRQLEYFTAVAQELNFTRAAARCHVVQSALSYQIARLEKDAGVQLFERSSRAVRLTAAGELLLPRARRILAEVDQARAALAELSGLVTGRLHLGMIRTADSLPELETALAEFHRRHPGVEITVSDTGSVHMVEQVRNGQLDLAFVGLFAEQVPEGLAHRVLTVEPLVAVVSRQHPLAERRTVGLAELAETTSFIEMRRGSGLRHQVDAAFERAGVQRTIAFELGSPADLVRFSALGLGAALVPAHSARRFRPDAKSVRLLRLDDPAATHPVSLIHLAPAPSAPSARAFLANMIDL